MLRTARTTRPRTHAPGRAAAALALTIAAAPAIAADRSSTHDALALSFGAQQADVVFYDDAELREFQQSQGFTDGTPPLIIPAAGFVDGGFGTDWSFLLDSGLIYHTGGFSSECVQAPVYLAPGARILNFFAYLYDQDVTNDMSATLWRKRSDGRVLGELLAQVSSSGSGDFVQIPGDTTIDYDDIVSSSYSYYVSVCFYDEQELHGIWIYYEPPVAPIAPFETTHLTVASSSGGGQVLVEEKSATTARRQLFRLENNGPPEFVLKDTDRGLTWKFGTRSDTFEINRGGSGQTEMILRANGDLDIKGTLSQGSSRTLKEQFEALDSREVLAEVGELPLFEWSYRGAGATDRHFGPMAEDFYEAFGLGNDPERLAPGDAAGIALAAIQGLQRRVEEQAAESERALAALRAEIDRLRRAAGIAP